MTDDHPYEKADNISLDRCPCGCGRLRLILHREDDSVIASCQFDDDAWLDISEKIIEALLKRGSV
jgi:hypothetical protein